MLTYLEPLTPPSVEQQSQYADTWFPCYTAGLLMVARSGAKIEIAYMPKGYAGNANYIVVWPENVRIVDGRKLVEPEGVYVTSDLDEAVRLKLKHGGQLFRNPEKPSDGRASELHCEAEPMHTPARTLVGVQG